MVVKRRRLDGRLPAIRVSASVEHDVKRLAEASGVTTADVVREAVEFFFAQTGTNSTKICNNSYQEESQA